MLWFVADVLPQSNKEPSVFELFKCACLAPSGVSGGVLPFYSFPVTAPSTAISTQMLLFELCTDTFSFNFGFSRSRTTRPPSGARRRPPPRRAPCVSTKGPSTPPVTRTSETSEGECVCPAWLPRSREMGAGASVKLSPLRHTQTSWNLWGSYMPQMRTQQPLMTV